jgi:uncharacterized protein YjbI with pentapeptide repeats
MSNPVDELTTSVNEAAQTLSGLLISLTLAAATLVAVVFAATDDAILRDSLSLVPQLGLSVPLSMITRVAPPFFVLLHAVALLQLNLLDSRINQLRTAASHRHAEEGGNHYRDRLAGIAFFRPEPNDKGCFAPKDEGQSKPKDKGGLGCAQRALAATIFFLISVPVPLLTLLIFQIGFLRGQDGLAILIQKSAFAADGLLVIVLLALPWYSRGAVILAALVGVVLSWFHATLPEAGLSGCQVRWSERTECEVPEPAIYRRNIIDAWICPNWGLDWCRQLNVENLSLLNEIVPTKATVDVIDRIKPGGRAVDQILATIIGLDLRSGYFRYADFTNTLLYGAKFGHAQLQGASFQAAVLDYAQFRFADLEKASFNQWRKHSASLRNAYLRDALLKNADLRGADLTNADLTGADLTKAMVDDETNFTGVIWTGAKLKGVDLMGNKTVDSDKVREACGDAATKLPSNVTIKPCDM